MQMTKSLGARVCAGETAREQTATGLPLCEGWRVHMMREALLQLKKPATQPCSCCGAKLEVAARPANMHSPALQLALSHGPWLPRGFIPSPRSPIAIDITRMTAAKRTIKGPTFLHALEVYLRALQDRPNTRRSLTLERALSCITAA